MIDIGVTANGERLSVAAGTTIAALMDALDLPRGRVAVEHNGALVPRERFGEIVLSEGDRLEVVTLVGGG